MDGEEPEGVVEVHTYVGGVVACFGRCAARNCLEGGVGGGFEALGENRANTSWALAEMASRSDSSPAGAMSRCRSAGQVLTVSRVGQ